MSDYQFQCPDCKKYTVTHSTGNVPETDEVVECISCGRVCNVEEHFATLKVSMTSLKNSPSELEKVEKFTKSQKGVKKE